jgi:hypothetical protein
LRDLGLKWFTESDISVGKDLELLRSTKESGCAQILVGPESPRADGLDGVECGATGKRHQPDCCRSIEAIQQAGITVMTPFPGTRRSMPGFWPRGASYTYVGAWERWAPFDVNSVPQRMSVEALEVGFRDLMVRIYERGFVAECRRAFFRRWREVRAAADAGLSGAWASQPAPSRRASRRAS